VRVTESNYRSRGYGMFVLELKATGLVVGFCGLVHPDGQPEAEIKYAFQQSAWGQGLATEAARELLAYGARAHRLQRVVATAAPDNKASHRVLAKAGMVPEGVRLNEDGSRTQVFAWLAGAGENAA
jgi:RimJ/RimL family protein N-acetyltransferase